MNPVKRSIDFPIKNENYLSKTRILVLWHKGNLGDNPTGKSDDCTLSSCVLSIQHRLYSLPLCLFLYFVLVLTDKDFMSFYQEKHNRMPEAAIVLESEK